MDIDIISKRLDVLRDYDCNRITFGAAVVKLIALGMSREDAREYLED